MALRGSTRLFSHFPRVSCPLRVPCVLRWHAGCRHLYTPAALGLDQYQQQRKRTALQFDHMQDSFKARIQRVLAAENKTMIFTEDFKNALHLCEATEEDLDMVVEMARRFNQQHKGLRFGMFVFGPVVMRTLHTLKQPQAALQAIRDEKLHGFFDQMVSYQTLMDLLYKSRMYSEVVEVFEEVQERRIGGVRFPKNCLILAVAAHFKMNTQESLDQVLGLLEKMQEYGVPTNRRLLVMCAALALNRHHPHKALEMMQLCRSITHIAVRSIKVMALSDLGRVQEALVILRSITEIDLPKPQSSNRGLYILREAVTRLGDAVREEGEDKILVTEFDRLCKCLEEVGGVSEKSLDELVTQPIEPFQPTPTDRRQNRAILAASFDRGGQKGERRPPRTPRRQGLMDME